jgi:Protein of unknown function (DUF3574)
VLRKQPRLPTQHKRRSRRESNAESTAGLTLLTGYGQFRNAANVIVEEQSFVMILLYPRDDKATSAEIKEIRTAYKDAFAQGSVLRVDSLGRVSF